MLTEFGIDERLAEVADQTALQVTIHASHADDRKAILEALITSESDAHADAARRMAGCASSASLHWHEPTAAVRPHVLRCHHRLCPHCARIRSASLTAQVHAHILDWEHPRFIVLTVAHREAPLVEQLADLRANFARLRRTGFWETAVRRGVYTVEVTQNPTSLCWHPHLNVIYEGEYIPQKLLKFHWERITGDSKIVWISDVHDRQGAAYELCKYIGKPQHISGLSQDAIREYATAVHAAHMIQPFGEKPPPPIEDDDPEDPLPVATLAITLARLMYLARLGNVPALEILQAAALRWPMFARYVYTGIPALRPPDAFPDTYAGGLAAARGSAPPPKRPPRAPPDLDALNATMVKAFERLNDDVTLGNLPGDPLAED
jgi:hypothetical protein